MPFKLPANVSKSLSSVPGAFGDAAKGALGGALSNAVNKSKLPGFIRGPVKAVLGEVFGGPGKKPTIKVSNLQVIQDWRASLTWDPEVWTLIPGATTIFSYLPNEGNVPRIYWPFTPQVTVNYTANYESIHTPHTNMATPMYNNSNVADLTVSGEFVANTVNDANYVYAVIHFLKSATKSFNYADPASLRGAPPPVMNFNYLGKGGFKDFPCVLTGVNITYPKDVDYVSTGFSDQTLNSMVPAECTISVSLMPSYSRAILSGDTKDTAKYSTEAFIDGKLIGKRHF